MAQDRFVTVYTQGTFHVLEIIIDTLTGVNYLRSATAKGESIAPLYDPYGKPIVTPLAPQRPPQAPPQMPSQRPPYMPPQMPPYMPPQ